MKKFNIDNYLSNSKLLTKELFERPESLSQYFPWDEYLEEHKLFLLKDGSIGVVFDVRLVEHEPLETSEILAAVNSLKDWLSFDERFVVQVLYDQSLISSKDKLWDSMLNNYTSPHPVSYKLFEKKLSCIKESNNALFRDTKLSIRFFPDYLSSKVGRKDALPCNDKLLLKELKKFKLAVKEFNNTLKNLERNSYLELSRINADKLAEILRYNLNPHTFYKRSFAPLNLSESLSNQLLYNSPNLDYSGIQREGIKSKTLSLKTAPNYAFPGGMAYFSNLNFPFRLSLNFSFPSKSKVSRFFEIKEFFLDKTQTEKGKRQLKEIQQVKQKLAHNDAGLYMTFNVTVESDNDEELDSRVNEIIGLFNSKLECEIIEEEDIGLGLYLNTLPLNYSPLSDLSSQRFIRILRSDAIKFLPIFNSFTGLDNPLQVYLSRENNLINFNLLENQTSNHTVVVADTGSGKSAFILDCVQAAKRMSPEPLIFVVDKKSSYKMMSKYFDGDLTIFGANNDIPFSPFRGKYDEQKISFLTKLISTAVSLSSPNFTIESEHIASITKALKLAYINKLQRAGLEYTDGELIKTTEDQIVELTMEDFISELASLTSLEEFESLESSIEELLNKLKPFYGDGKYSKYFNKSPNSNHNSSLFYVYDLDALDGDKTLQVLMTMSVFEEIRQKIQTPENQERGGFIIIEELGMLGRNNPKAAEFVIDAAETFRKLGFWLVALTPNPRNYFELDVGKAMWAAADNFIFLKLGRDNIDYIQNNSKLLNEATVQVLESLETIKDQYADVFYINKNKSKQGAFRYVQTPLDKWLAPTNAKDNQRALKALKQFKGEHWKALEYLAYSNEQGENQ